MTFERKEVYCIEASELEFAAKIARAHNAVCTDSLSNSGEDGLPYCRYKIDVSGGGVGPNLYLVCRECCERTYFAIGHNL